MSKSTKQKRFGIFYKREGQWSGPYQGKTYAERYAKSAPFLEYVSYLNNDLLKSKIKLVAV